MEWSNVFLSEEIKLNPHVKHKKILKIWYYENKTHELWYIQLLCVRFLNLHVSKFLWLLKFLVRWHVRGVAPAKTGGWGCMKGRAPWPEPWATLPPTPHYLEQKGLPMTLCPCLGNLGIGSFVISTPRSSKSHEADTNWLGYHTNNTEKLTFSTSVTNVEDKEDGN